MPAKKIPDIQAGETFGRWKILGKPFHTSTTGKTKYWYVVCECSCGVVSAIRVNELERGNSKSCGCLNKEILIENCTSHGLSNHPFYNIWGAMVQRCCNPKSEAYHIYGGRGITICEEWRNKPESFIKWAIKNGYKKGLHVDRIDNDKGYSPNNCRVVTPQENCMNTSRNHWITYEGETRTIMQWSDKLKIPYSRIRNRLKKGWALKDVLNPNRLYRRHA